MFNTNKLSHRSSLYLILINKYFVKSNNHNVSLKLAFSLFSLIEVFNSLNVLSKIPSIFISQL